MCVQEVPFKFKGIETWYYLILIINSDLTTNPIIIIDTKKIPILVTCAY